MKLIKKLNCQKINIDINKRIFFHRLCESCYNKYFGSVEIKEIIDSDIYKRFLLEINT